MPNKTKFASLEEYLEARRPRTVLDAGGDLRSIGRSCGISAGEVRGALPRLGYHLETNSRGIRVWARPVNMQELAQEKAI
jgi:hypothetical protein